MNVIISNCVINLSVDKRAVIAEMLRLLNPGGRIGISDVNAEDHLTPAQRAERGRSRDNERRSSCSSPTRDRPTSDRSS